MINIEKLNKLTRLELRELIIKRKPSLSVVSFDGCPRCHRGYINKDEMIKMLSLK